MAAREYELRLYDTTLARFALDEDILGVRRYELTCVDEPRHHLLPLDIICEATSDRIQSWLQMRSIPKHRAFVKELLAQIGLHPEDAGFYQGVIDYCHGLSVNDSYWVVECGFKGNWSEYNLYENDLDNTLALIAYTGYTSSQKHKIGLSSEWSTGGTYPKAWRRIGDDLVLYKAGSSGGANTGNEPYSEWFSQQVAEAMGIPHVSYGLEMWGGKLASTCKLANTKSLSLVSWWQATRTSKFPESLAAAKLMGSHILEAFEDMVVFDCLTMNYDRHSTNFGLMRNNETGEILGMAPLFDHNLALFPEDMPSDFSGWATRGATWMPRWADIPYDRVLPFVLDERHRAGLRRLLDFNFKQHPTYPVPLDRLNALNQLVQMRAKTALGVTPLSEQEKTHLLSPLMDGLTSIPALYEKGSLIRHTVPSSKLQSLLSTSSG